MGSGSSGCRVKLKLGEAWACPGQVEEGQTERSHPGAGLLRNFGTPNPTPETPKTRTVIGSSWNPRSPSRLSFFFLADLLRHEASLLACPRLWGPDVEIELLDVFFLGFVLCLLCTLRIIDHINMMESLLDAKIIALCIIDHR